MMVVFSMARKLWLVPQHLLCAMLNVQIISSRLQQILCWIMLIGIPMLILCGLVVFRCLLFGSFALMMWGEAALSFMFLLVAMESFSLLLLVRLSPLQEDLQDCICHKETVPIPVHDRPCKSTISTGQQEFSKKPALAKPQRHLSQVLPPLARQIAHAEDLAKMEPKTPSEPHRARVVPVDRIPTILLNLPKSPMYASALRHMNKLPSPSKPTRDEDI